MRWQTWGVALLCAAVGTSVADAAAIVTHIYELNGSYADTLGGPAITPAGGTLGPTGYSFAAGQGPSLTGAISPATYSLEMLFRIDNTSGYRKLLDFKNRTSDFGLYNLNTAVEFYETVLHTGPAGAITAGALVHLVVTRDGVGSEPFSVYIDGALQAGASFNDGGDNAVFSSNIIHFLRDDVVFTGEDPAGFLDRVRIYDGVLTPDQVGALFRGGDPPGLPAAPTEVPEPATMCLFGAALAVSLLRRR